MRIVIAALAALLAACATPAPPTPPPPPVSAAPVIEAERAFAADAAQRGWIAAFRTWTAPDGVLLRPGPVSAPADLAARPDTGDKALKWWPAYAGVSRSGDFGFTTGPVRYGDDAAVRMHYFTVWRRQPDGAWRWVFDGGVPVTDANPFSDEQQQIPTLPVAEGGAASAAAAIAEVAAIERANGASAKLQALLIPTARAHRSGQPPAQGEDSVRALMQATDVRYEFIRAEASAGGDLVMTLSHARWRADGVDRASYGVRIWQWRPEGWRLAYDQIAPPPRTS